MWTPESIEKARTYESAKLLCQGLSSRYPWLLGCTINQVIARLAPVRFTPDGHMVRFYGVDCFFPHDDEAAVALFLIQQFMNATGPVSTKTITANCDLAPRRKLSDILKRCTAYQMGLITRAGPGLYGWKIPEDEKNKPKLLIVPAA